MGWATFKEEAALIAALTAVESERWRMDNSEALDSSEGLR